MTKPIVGMKSDAIFSWNCIIRKSAEKNMTLNFMPGLVCLKVGQYLLNHCHGIIKNDINFAEERKVAGGFIGHEERSYRSHQNC